MIGFRRCRSLARSWACAAAFASAIGACSGDELLVGQERATRAPGADEPEGSGVVSVVPSADVVSIDDCPSSAAERLSRPGCWPTLHVGTWRGFFVGVPRYAAVDGSAAEFPPGAVLLELAADGRAQLTFGAPPESSVANEPPMPLCAPSDPTPGCSMPGQVVAGFAYELAELALLDPELAPAPSIAGEPPLERAGGMTFVVPLSEPWDAWCSPLGLEPEASCSGGDCSAGGRPAPGVAIDSPGRARSKLRDCRCDRAGCRAEVPFASLSIALQMAKAGDALRGRYKSNGAGFADAWLELRKASEQ